MEPQRTVILSGHPTDLEVAAITAALQRHRSTTAAGEHQAMLHQRRPSAAMGRTSRWARAARLESCGYPPIDSPTSFTL